MRNVVLFIATGAGSGYLPIAPGTAGAALGVLLFAALAWGLGTSGPVLLGATVGLAALGVWAAGRAESAWETRDDPRITIDEIAGQFTSLLFLPPRLEVWLLGFLLFRILDIWKPPPARWAERLGGGIGVVADDLVAGAYANAVGQIIWRVAWPGEAA